MKNLKTLFVLILLSSFSFSQTNYVLWDDFEYYPLQDGVNAAEFCESQYTEAGFTIQPTGPDEVNCHGYAWFVATGTTVPVAVGSEPRYDMGSNDVNAYFPDLESKICSKEDATHLVYMSLDSTWQHSAIISQFSCFPYEDDWVQSINGPWPGTNVIIHKIDFNLGTSDFIVYYNLRDENGNLPWTELPAEPSYCPPSQCILQLGAISGPSSFVSGGRPVEYSVGYCEDVDYVWSYQTNVPFGSLTMQPNASEPNKCRVNGSVSGFYNVILEAKVSGYVVETFQKQIYIGASFTTKSNGRVVQIENQNLQDIEMAYTYQLLDINGKVHAKKISSDKSVEFDTTALSEGIYIIQVITDTNVASYKIHVAK